MVYLWQLLTKYEWKLLDNVNMTEKRVKHMIIQEIKILARQMATDDPSSDEEPIEDKLDYFSSLYAK